jgi:hypothetical protein
MKARDPARSLDAPGASSPAGVPVHNRSDHFAKAILRDALGCASIEPPETEVEVVVAAQKIDVYAVPDPARAAERAKMGWLGEIFMASSLFEPFSTTPNLARARRVICKQHVWHHELTRRAAEAARAEARTAEGRTAAAEVEIVPFPRLVVISTGRPDTVLDKYGCREVRRGWYASVEGLQMLVLVLAEIPRARETLMLRLLGAGRVLAAALDDLAALPEDAWERSVSWPILLKFGLVRDGREATSDEEDEMNAEIRAWYEQYERNQQQLRAQERREAHEQGRDEGLREGRAEEAARAVLTAFRVRGIAVPDAARERILAERDPARLERWHEKAIVAASLGDVFDDPS